MEFQALTLNLPNNITFIESAYSSGTKQKKQKRTTQKTSSSRDEGSVAQPTQNPVAQEKRPKSVNMSIEV